MLERIIRNSIITAKGEIYPDKGLALRGPLSQFFGAIYLKPLDDAFANKVGYSYVRFQDDIVLFCQTKRQLKRAKRLVHQVLQERQLTLSRTKSRCGRIEDGFHFLGVDYGVAPKPLVEDAVALMLAEDIDMDSVAEPIKKKTITENRTENITEEEKKTRGRETSGVPTAREGAVSAVPLITANTNNPPPLLQPRAHARTLRNAREKVRCLLTSRLSAEHAATYLSHPPSLKLWRTRWAINIDDFVVSCPA